MINGIKDQINWYNYGQYWGNGIAILLTPLFTHGIQGIFVASSKPKVDMKIVMIITLLCMELIRKKLMILTTNI